MSVIASSSPAPALAWPRSLTRPIAVALGALVLCWAALVNGGAFLHPDSISYIRGPDVAVMKLFGERYGTAWAKHDPGAVDQRRALDSAQKHVASYNDDEVLAGRSIYYGALAYLGMLTGGFWLTVFVQGLGVAVLADIVLRALGRRRLATYALTVGALAALTPAPLFVGLMVPDIWVGVAIGAAAALFAFPGRLTRLDLAILAALVAFGAIAHNSAVLILAGLFVAGGLSWVLFRRALPDPRPALAVIAGALVVAMAANAVFGLMVQKAAGKPPLMPAFVTARLVADGPGARYVNERCHGEFVVCRYAGRLPHDMDDFLWADQPDKAVFETASSADRRALSAEQTRFALAVVRAYPLEQAAATAKNVALQLFTTELKDFGYPAALRANLEGAVPEADLAKLEKTAAFAEAWPLKPLWALQTAVTVMALAAAAWLLTSRRRDLTASEDGRLALVFLGFVAVGLLLNGAACGALSALHGRYQARAIWELPLAVALLAATLPGRALKAR